jgi:zinc-ribbon family
MPIIIWGTRGITSTVDQGEFFCPHCDAREEYALKRIRPFFTLYFIPLFPVGGGQRYVECHGCRQTFKEEVLDYQPPSEAERLFARAYEDLRAGVSLESARQTLIERGVAEADVEEVLDKMCDGRPRACACGLHFHPDVRKCLSCGRTL